MRRLYFAFLRGLAANRISQVGVFLTTSAFILFILFQLGSLVGWMTNAYLGLVMYLALPALFVIGLFLIPFGWWRHSRETGRPFRDLYSRRFTNEDIQAREAGAPVVRIIVLLTLINVVFMGIVGTTTLHFMDEPHFCGTACHSVMNPEWTTYQESPHAHVKCVECHVGDGIVPLFKSKLNGAWQMVSATFNLYEQPIPTPVHQLRPARETCEDCHWPDKFIGNRVINRASFASDSASTPEYTTLMMKIGTGSPGQANGSHWHVAEDNQVRYASIDDERQEMIWVEVLQPDGSWKRYVNQEHVEADVTGREHVRIMDCVDCHNRATHIYEDPGYAIDESITRGEIPLTLPYIKREALAALYAHQGEKTRSLAGIELRLNNWYQREYPQLIPLKQPDLDRAINAIQAIYERNIHPGMNIYWGAYPSHIGHRRSDYGCFRCHTSGMVADDGSNVNGECTLCHSILADGAERPFMYLEPPAEASPDSVMHQYLHEEFWSTVTKEPR